MYQKVNDKKTYFWKVHSSISQAKGYSPWEDQERKTRSRQCKFQLRSCWRSWTSIRWSHLVVNIAIVHDPVAGELTIKAKKMKVFRIAFYLSLVQANERWYSTHPQQECGHCWTSYNIAFVSNLAFVSTKLLWRSMTRNDSSRIDTLMLNYLDIADMERALRNVTMLHRVTTNRPYGIVWLSSPFVIVAFAIRLFGHNDR